MPLWVHGWIGLVRTYVSSKWQCVGASEALPRLGARTFLLVTQKILVEICTHQGSNSASGASNHMQKCHLDKRYIGYMANSSVHHDGVELIGLMVLGTWAYVTWYLGLCIVHSES